MVTGMVTVVVVVVTYMVRLLAFLGRDDAPRGRERKWLSVSDW